jgi:hypothetical protein
MDALRGMLFRHRHAAWRRRWMGVTVAWMVCGAGWVLVYAIPNQFESTARMFVDADAVLTPLLRGLAADSSPTTQLEILQRTLLSRPNIDPPEIPRLPTAPNRLLLVTGVLLGGLTTGGGLTVLFGQLDRSFATVDELRSLGLPVLGGISILGLISFREQMMVAVRFGAAVAMLGGVYVGLMAHILRSAALI